MAPTHSPPTDRARWRVHAGSAGFGELSRLVEPLRSEPADAFFLLEAPRSDLARAWFKVRDVNVEQAVKEAGVPHVETLKVDLWDPMKVGNALARAMLDNGFETLFVNVSTGPNTVGIGAALASLFWDLRLYYAVSDYSAPKVSEVQGWPFKGVGWLPTFHHDAPRQEVLEALKVISTHPAGLSSSKYKTALREGEEPVIRPKGKSRSEGTMKPQAVHGQFLTIVKHLTGWHLVREETRYGEKHFRITDEGTAYLRLFDGIPGPSEDGR